MSMNGWPRSDFHHDDIAPPGPYIGLSMSEGNKENAPPQHYGAPSASQLPTNPNGAYPNPNVHNRPILAMPSVPSSGPASAPAPIHTPKPPSYQQSQLETQPPLRSSLNPTPKAQPTLVLKQSTIASKPPRWSGDEVRPLSNLYLLPAGVTPVTLEVISWVSHMLADYMLFRHRHHSGPRINGWSFAEKSGRNVHGCHTVPGSAHNAYSFFFFFFF